MSEIKVGDWVEVVEPNDRHRHMGIKAGDRYKVSSLDGDDGVLVKREDCSFFVSIHYGRIKKAEPLPVQVKALCTPLEHGGAKKERVASSHYQNANNNDVWQFVDDNLSAERVKGFHQTNAIKYVTRYHVKHDATAKRIEDLEKAKVCIDKLIELERLDCNEDIDREG